MRKYQYNQVYCCDNIELLLDWPENSIDLIYCDILYGTGKDFGDFKDLKAEKDIIFDFYYERLIHMFKLLKPSGSIYIQMDTHINHWIRNIMDSIFGYSNFINELVWWKKRFSQNNNSSFLRNHDYIILYSKSNDYFFNPQYVYNEDKHKRIKKGYFNCGDGYLVYDWNEFNKFKKRNSLNNDVRTIDRTDEEPTTKCHDVFDDINFINSQSDEFLDYATQKPLKLMERLIKASSKPGDTVADFFMGSGSFLVKANELNRKFIGCDINPNAVDITRKRL